MISWRGKTGREPDFDGCWMMVVVLTMLAGFTYWVMVRGNP
jgi:hypothetical protein